MIPALLLHPHGPRPILLLAGAAILVEAVWGGVTGRIAPAPRETLVSFGVWVGHVAIRLLTALPIAALFAGVHAHRLFDLDATTLPGALALFTAFEFTYCWHHRASHRIRWFWATHAVHHSSTRLHLPAALRLGWTDAISGHFLFYLPLAWIGWSPVAIAVAAAIDLGWQFFLHTELVPALGPFERVLNTPRHHAVHHGSDPDCRDRNFGGVVIVFDRLFGTFAERPARPLSYGLAGREPTNRLSTVVFGEWRRLFAEVGAARSPRSLARALFGAP